MVCNGRISPCCVTKSVDRVDWKLVGAAHILSGLLCKFWSVRLLVVRLRTFLPQFAKSTTLTLAIFVIDRQTRYRFQLRSTDKAMMWKQCTSKAIYKKHSDIAGSTVQYRIQCNNILTATQMGKIEMTQQASNEISMDTVSKSQEFDKCHETDTQRILHPKKYN